MGADGWGREEAEKTWPRNYCGSETCATAVYLNEACENADSESPSEGEKERKKREKEESGEEKREKSTETEGRETGK